MRSERIRTGAPVSVSVGCLWAAGLAPGGFVLGYLAGHVAGRTVGGCPLRGFCAEITPVLLALACGVLGLGVGNTLAALRVRYWWEGVAVWAAGILASLTLVALLGLIGPITLPGLLVAAASVILALVLTIATLRRSEEPSEHTPARS